MRIIKKDFCLTPATKATIEKLVSLYRTTTGAQLSASHALRAVLMAVEHCFDQIKREASQIGELVLPSNAPGNELQRERFEAELADSLVAGMRSAAAFHHKE